MAVEITTGVVRVVWGNPTKARDVVDTQTKTKRVDKDGNPRKQISFGIAVPKAEWAAVEQAMVAAAAAEFPNGFPGNFAWKFKDGDTFVDGNGKRGADREGWAGCNVLACSTELVSSVGVFAYNQATQKWEATQSIKTGDYVKVTLTLNAHKARNNTEKPGLYVNPTAVMLWQVGPEIKGASEFDPNARGFAPPPPQTPPQGATMPGAPAPQAPAYTPPAPQGGPPAAPHTQFLRGPVPDSQ